MQPKWMTQDSSKWSTYVMKTYIQDQNGYSYDGNSPMRHSAERLANFVYLKGEQREKFIKVYNKMYKKAA